MSDLYSSLDQKRAFTVPLSNPKDTRSNFRRDFARLIHSPSFRRLQGKTQLFPGIESDFFRNRLTHSLEVAQIAKSIAQKFNSTDKYFRANPINLDIVETAALAHDLGHPPFGHNGEEALDFCMKKYGGFEGNAQTLRILACLEKRELSPGLSNGPDQLVGVDLRGKDFRNGLNLTYRTLASVLKYDKAIPLRRNRDSGVQKGYYSTEKDLVKTIKKNILNGKRFKGRFKTIECSIMDIADDIAYSTYDLEDALKGGFVDPLDFVKVAVLEEYNGILRNVARGVSKKLNRNFSVKEVTKTLFNSVREIFVIDGADTLDYQSISHRGLYATVVSKISEDVAKCGYLRTRLTSSLVNEFISGVKVKLNRKIPPLSEVYLERNTLKKVEVLKHFTFEVIIMSSMLKVVQYRGDELVKTIFTALAGGKGNYLLPDDFKKLFTRFRLKSDKMRVICDFIAGMTDRYAVEFFNRLSSDNAQSIFKPL